MTRITVALMAMIVGSIVATNFACKDSQYSSLRWPPDTIIVVQVSGDIYQVTTSPEAEDPEMLLRFVWPPDTMSTDASLPGTIPGEDQTVFRTVSATTPFATPARYSPHTLPLQILMIWPPDTMNQ
jgi:hypothetical protein